MAAAKKTVPTDADVQSHFASPVMSGALADATCPRCGGGFECGAAAGHCDCFGLRLTETLRHELAAHYSSCLCMRCLRDVKDGASAAPLQPVMGSAKASG